MAASAGSWWNDVGTMALNAARRNVDAWTRELENGGLDAILVTASGCGTTIKDYAFMLRDDESYAQKASRVSALARDISEFLHELPLKEAARTTGQIVAYHAACSMQHGQQIRDQPKSLLTKVGFVVKDVPEGHICCGSAGIYNVLQPDIANRLRARKVVNIEKTKPQLIASGNLGCMTQIGLGTNIPVVHTVELLDWATGGPLPDALEGAQVECYFLSSSCAICCWLGRFERITRAQRKEPRLKGLIGEISKAADFEALLGTIPC